jgi:N-acetylneuraminate lyase
MSDHFKGVWPALVTPLTPDDGIDVETTQRLVNDLIDKGVHGFYVCGGTGEGVLLPVAARRVMAETVIEQANGRVPVIVHVGAVSTAEAVELAAHAASVGADAVAAVPPFYYAVDFEAIKAHYQLIAGASDLPLYLYYIPGTTGVELTAGEMWELCQLSKVAGFKYSAFDLFKLERILALAEGSLNVFTGPDQLFMPCQMLGVDGAIGTTYNILPRHFLKLYEACQQGDISRARRLQSQANDVIETFIAYGGIPAVKEILGFLGYDVGHCRRPLGRLTPSQVESLHNDLASVNFWDLVGE